MWIWCSLGIAPGNLSVIFMTNLHHQIPIHSKILIGIGEFDSAPNWPQPLPPKKSLTAICSLIYTSRYLYDKSSPPDANSLQDTNWNRGVWFRSELTPTPSPQKIVNRHLFTHLYKFQICGRGIQYTFQIVFFTSASSLTEGSGGENPHLKKVECKNPPKK